MDGGPEDWPPFSIQAISYDNSETEDHTLTPHFVLPRTCLPLNYLDPSAGRDGVTCQALFFAQISVLEQDIDDEQFLSPFVLIARSDRTKQYLVVERIGAGMYTLCTMCRWVSIDVVKTLRETTLTLQHVFGPSIGTMSDDHESTWWKVAAIPSYLPSSLAHRDSQHSQQIASCKLALRTFPADDTSLISANEKKCFSIELEQSDADKDIGYNNGTKSPEEVIKTIKCQYQEALYISRSSLAYFAKGPLSRARAQFCANRTSEPDFQNLTQCLRAMILPLPAMDKKYRETLPKAIKDLPYNVISDDEISPLIESINSRRQRSKKDKIGKDGLYPGESTKIAQWWLSRDSSDGRCDAEEAREHFLKTMLLAQRARETQLQIILALEIIALEDNALDFNAKTSMADVPIHEQEKDTKRMKKANKPQDLHLLLDILADRLCIWQTMSLQPGDPSKQDQIPASGSKKSAGVSALSNDTLQQFCVDVVLPFYGARCPQLSKSICQKLGGAKVLSPRRHDLAQTAEGAEACITIPSSIRTQSKRRPKRTLERVMTDDKLKLRPPACLSRSATEPVLPRIKREISDTSLPSVLSSRVAMSKRYSQREVDIQSASQVSGAKGQRAVVEQELRGAIAALKRPNPRLAVREVVDAADDRRIKSHPRKIKRPQRNPFAQDLQIVATPSKHRTSAGQQIPPNQKSRGRHNNDDDDDKMPSSVIRIPCSTTKCGNSVTARRQNLDKSNMISTTLVDQTPTKKSTKSRLQSSNTFASGIDAFGDTHLAQAPSPSNPAKPFRSFEGDDSFSTAPFTITHTGPDDQNLPSKMPSQRPPQPFSSNEVVKPLKAKLLRPPSPNFDEEPAMYADLGWTYDFND